MRTKEIRLLKYYGVLLLLLFTWVNSMALPSLPLRLIYCILVVFPVVYFRLQWLPVILTTFVTISMNRFAPSYMPAVPSMITVLLVLVYMVTQGVRISNYKVPSFIYIILLWVFCVDLFTAQKIHYLVFTLLNIILLFRYFVISTQNKELFMHSFVIISLLLSIELLVFGSNFTEAYSSGDIERVGWRDPNVFSCILGMGVLVSLIKMFQSKSLINSHNILYALTIIISLIAILKNASRGATLALFVSVILLVAISNFNKKRKFIVIISGISLLILLYQLDVFSTLEARFGLENTETGGERTIIWGVRLNHFINDPDVFHWIFGYGQEYGCNIGFAEYLGFHSDFVAFFVEYGIIGFLLFIYMLFYPILKAKKNKPIVIAGIVYLVLCSLTLDLFGNGNITFFAFYLYLLLMSQAD